MCGQKIDRSRVPGTFDSGRKHQRGGRDATRCHASFLPFPRAFARYRRDLTVDVITRAVWKITIGNVRRDSWTVCSETVDNCSRDANEPRPTRHSAPLCRPEYINYPASHRGISSNGYLHSGLVVRVGKTPFCRFRGNPSGEKSTQGSPESTKQDEEDGKVENEKTRLERDTDRMVGRQRRLGVPLSVRGKKN